MRTVWYDERRHRLNWREPEANPYRRERRARVWLALSLLANALLGLALLLRR